MCADMALLFCEVIMEGGLDDESVSRGLHRAGRRLRDRWLKENFLDIALGDYGRRCSKNRITNPVSLIAGAPPIEEAEEKEGEICRAVCDDSRPKPALLSSVRALRLMKLG